MRIEVTFLRSKVGRRMFVLFVLCALIPIGTLAIISFAQVTDELNRQSQKRLSQASKAYGMAIFERLGFLEAEMKLMAFGLRTSQRTTIPNASEGFARDLKHGFNGVALCTQAGEQKRTFGLVQRLPRFTSVEMQAIRLGRTVISDDSSSDLMPRVFMTMAIDFQHPARGIISGEINTGYLIDVEPSPALAKLCLLNSSNQLLVCSAATPDSFRDEVTRRINVSSSGAFEWNDGRNEYLASYWSIFLKAHFLTPMWKVAVNESRTDVLTPIANFKKTFPLVIAVSLLMVLLLSLVQIRRSLIPLERLQEATRRIAKKDFDHPVVVASRDEFQELATSFNTMASRLDRQFKALTTINDIDRAILSSLDTERIVNTVLTSMPNLLPCRTISVTLLDASSPHSARTYIGCDVPGSYTQLETTTVTPEDVQALRNHPEALLINAAENLPPYLAPLTARGMRSFLVLPIFLKETFSGTIVIGHDGSVAHTPEDILQARQIADQVAVALSNASLIKELEQFNRGTLTALARAIDAKSPWTSGHSERVTKLAIKIGRTLRLPSKELEILHRGGLLHDIGKIGTPSGVLDKAGKLDQKELRLMREHVGMGARILEPIPEFADVLPIVLHHHEWFDGSGYPDGLAGGAIPLHARIFAVADVFDALASDRPYRRGLPRGQVIDSIRERAGSQFDPKVVQAFLEVVSQHERESAGEIICEPLRTAS